MSGRKFCRERVGMRIEILVGRVYMEIGGLEVVFMRILGRGMNLLVVWLEVRRYLNVDIFVYLV